MRFQLAKRSVCLGVCAACAVVSAISPALLEAGPIFFVGSITGGKFVSAGEVDEPRCSIQFSTTSATIEADRARVAVWETIVGPEDPLEAVCLIPLPQAVDESSIDVSISISGSDRRPSVEVQFLDSAEAQEIYEMLAQGTDSVEVLALTGRPAAVIRKVNLVGTLEVNVEFTVPIQQQDGIMSFRCPMPSATLTGGLVGRLNLSATIDSDKPLRAIFSPTHNASIERKGLHRAAVRVKADNHSGGDDFQLLWVAAEDDLGLRTLAHRARHDEDGYFILLGNPTGQAGRRQTIEKDVIFVLDTSGSMRGEKIEQAQAAINYCLGNLNPGDRFNCISFGTDVESFRDGPAELSKANLAAAAEFVDRIVAQGRTNINGALAQALAGSRVESRPRIAIFLTDGTPTAGELVPEKIVQNVREANRSQSRIFVMGVGHDVNAHLLDKLAEETDGSSEYVGAEEEIDAKIVALYDRLSHPVLTNVAVGFGRLRTHSVYPEKLPALFKGSGFMIAGRYRGGGPHTFTVSGTLAGEPITYSCRVDLPQAGTDETNDFVAPLWAARKIGYLLQEIRLHGEDEELLGEVVALSKRFGIVTEYTEFIAASSTDVSTEAAVAEARRQMGMANVQQAGQWAVNQAFNDRNLQNRMVAGNEGNTFVDRQGRVVATENVTQIGRQVFYLRDGQWVDAEDQAERPTEVVSLYSDEYFALLRNDRRFAQSQQLGWAVSINVGDRRVVVEKDGIQKDETLRRPEPEPTTAEQNLNQFQNQMQQIPRNQQFNQQLQINNRAIPQ